MPAPSQRMTSVRRAAVSARTAAANAKPAAQKVITEELVALPTDPDHGLDALSSSAINRSAPARSSRRMAAASSSSDRSRSSGRSSARRPLTPEEQLAKSKSTRSMLMIVGAVVVVAILVVVGGLVLSHKDPVVEAAHAKIAELRSTIPEVANRTAYNQAKADLSALPDVASIAAEKAQLSKDLTARESAVQHTERVARVDDNRRGLLAQLAKLTDPDLDLAKLAADCQAFVKNPVDPSGAPSSDAAQEFASAVSDIQLRLASVASEISRREIAATTGAVQKVRLEVEALLKEEKFGAAQAIITEAAGKYPKADFTKVSESITESAASAWKTVQGYVTNRMQDYATPGISLSVRQQALSEAKARLDAVIANWGLETYVTQAEALKAK